MSRAFQFKQFTVSQSNSPMKVGTDGVLLGAWVQGTQVNHILDIGTGTGLIALMMAQRFPHAQIIAIEPQEDAFADAMLNFSNSPFTERLYLQSTALQLFVPKHKFDLIVCNPPFFQNDLPAPKEGRNMARHAHSLRPAELAHTGEWLSSRGQLCGIYPVDVFQLFEKEALAARLQLRRVCHVKPIPQKSAKRVLFSFSNEQSGIEQAKREEITIEMGQRHRYTDAFTALVKDFYLYL